MGRSLYLSAGHPLKIKRDGPSVWIVSGSSGGRRVPLRLIDRVVIVGDVSIPASVVTLFAAHDIPVLFINHNEKEIALCLSTKPSSLRFGRRQAVFTSSDYNKRRYSDLISSWRSRNVIDVFKRLFKNNQKVLDRYVHSNMKDHYKRLLFRIAGSRKNIFAVARTFLKSVLLEEIVLLLKEAGFDPHQGVLHQGKKFSLAHDVLYVFEPEVTLMALRFIRSSNYEQFVIKDRIMSEGIKDLVTRYENRARYIKDMARRFIRELIDLLHELEHRGVMRFVSVEDQQDGTVSYML